MLRVVERVLIKLTHIAIGTVIMTSVAKGYKMGGQLEEKGRRTTCIRALLIHLPLIARQGAVEPSALGPGQRVIRVGC